MLVVRQKLERELALRFLHRLNIKARFVHSVVNRDFLYLPPIVLANIVTFLRYLSAPITPVGGFLMVFPSSAAIVQVGIASARFSWLIQG